MHNASPFGGAIRHPAIAALPQRSIHHLALAVLSVWVFFSANPARAALGEHVASVERDQAVLHGSRATALLQNYNIEEIVSASGATVREYVTHTGDVFAVTWSGSQTPNLKLLLGGHFEDYVSAARSHRGSHHVLSIDSPSLVMTVVRFQRSASGQVYLPRLMPRGVARRELR